jgi:hypothetical protein
VDKEEQWKNSRSNGKSISSKGFIESFRAKFAENSKQKEPIKYEQIRQDLWKKPWWFCQETIGNTKSVVEYLGRYP